MPFMIMAIFSYWAVIVQPYCQKGETIFQDILHGRANNIFHLEGVMYIATLCEASSSTPKLILL